MFTYRMSGLVVESEIALPGFAPLRPSGDADVHFVRAPVADRFGETTPGRLILRVEGEDIVVKRRDVGCYRLTGGRAVAFDPAPGADIADVALILAGSVFAILLHQRGHIVLHGSAIRACDRAILFCGDSGAGKSTLAAALGQRGWPLIADDVCAIDISGPAPMVHPDARWQKLWSESIDALNLEEQRGDAIRHRARKFYVEPGDVAPEPVAVAAVYVLAAGEAGDIRIERPSLADAALLIRRNAYRPRLVERLGRKQDYLRAAAGILAAGGIFRLVRPMDFARMAETVSELEKHWQGVVNQQKSDIASDAGNANP